MLRLIFSLFVTSACVRFGASYKILGIFSVPTGSHNILASKLFRDIANRGHEVTLLTPYPSQTLPKNLKEVPMERLQDMLPENNRSELFNLDTRNPLEKFHFVADLNFGLTKEVLQSKEMQEVLNSNEKFDAVVVYQYLNEAFLGIGHHLKVPTILFSSMPLYTTESFLLSHPAPSSYVPNILTEYTGHMNFWQRLRNTFYDAAIILYYISIYLPKHRQLVYDSIPSKPDLFQFINNASLVLINSHPSTCEAIPQVPNAVEIGGFHIQEPKKLPSDLQKFLDESKNGVVVFSMGSILKSADLPENKRTAIIAAFSKLKQNVLWKWEDGNLPNKPKNLKIMKWIPTNDILAHPNVKVFINHGGLLSTTESVHHAVPMIGIPILGDQKMNMAYAELNEYAIQIPFQELSEESLAAALQQALYNPKYKINIQKRSKILRDRPINPTESALYWIEYVIRHQGATHLRYPGMDLTWYQRNLLDVVGFVILISLVAIILIRVALNLIFKRPSIKFSKSKKDK